MAAALALFLLFAAAAAILLLHLVVAARAFRNQHHGWRSRYRVPETSSSSPPPPCASRAGLSPADLRLLPCFAAASSSPEFCAVCLEAACAGERWRALPACAHAFHAACVDRWLARAAACPVCRAAVSVSVS
uniref:RING-type domain-containing protein n=1 Tax=Oryza punctata TaxID=4537 RepID=A0A0E0JWC0_ORYPU